MKRVVLWCAVLVSTMLALLSLLFTVVAWFSMGGADFILPGLAVTFCAIVAAVAAARSLKYQRRAA